MKYYSGAFPGGNQFLDNPHESAKLPLELPVVDEIQMRYSLERNNYITATYLERKASKLYYELIRF